MKRFATVALICSLLTPTVAQAIDKRAAGLGLLFGAAAGFDSYLKNRRTQFITQRGSTSFPASGQDTSAAPGEAIYASYNYDAVKVARFLVDHGLINGAGIVRKGALVYHMVNGKFCHESGNRCYEDKDQDGKFDNAGRDRQTSKIVDIPYELDEVRLDASSEGFRAELVYQGAGGGVLRIGYREFVDDMARPAFSQELTYDLNPNGPTEIAFQGLRIEVVKAGNLKIDYRVFTPEQEPAGP